MRTVALSLVVATICALLQEASACPAIGRLPDFNCNGRSDVVVLGDSLVAGTGDTQVQGGYVARAQRKLREARLLNFGVPGQRALDLVQVLERSFRDEPEGALVRALIRADMIILDVGRNDRWFFGAPLATYRNLKRARTIINKQVRANTGHTPLVVTAVLMLPNRGQQGPWVQELNAVILRSHTTKTPADLRFDLVSKRLLSADRLHPTPEGYTQIANVLVNYLLRNFRILARALRPDLDRDKLYDQYEQEKFGTDPTLRDTDGDGIKDGLDEDPLTPPPTPTPTVTPTATSTPVV